MLKFLFMCTANRFRSKLEEATASKIFNTMIETDSCGIGSKKYGLSSPSKLIVKSVSKGLSEKIFLKKSKEINLHLVKWSDVIVYQQKNHLAKLINLYPKYKYKFVYLGDFYKKEKITRIPDLAFISNDKDYNEAMNLIIISTINLVNHYVKK